MHKLISFHFPFLNLLSKESVPTLKDEPLLLLLGLYQGKLPSFLDQEVLELLLQDLQPTQQGWPNHIL